MFFQCIHGSARSIVHMCIHGSVESAGCGCFLRGGVCLSLFVDGAATGRGRVKKGFRRSGVGYFGFDQMFLGPLDVGLLGESVVRTVLKIRIPRSGVGTVGGGVVVRRPQLSNMFVVRFAILGQVSV